MTEWSVLRTPGKEYLSQPYNNSDSGMSYHMMNSIIERTFAAQSQYDENTFCTPDTEDQCITYLNQELTVFGFSPLSHDSSSRCVSLVNTLHELLQLYQRNGRIKDELENRIHRLSSELNDAQSVVGRMKQTRERLERELTQEKEKHRQTLNKNKGILSKLKVEKEEVKRLQSVVKDRDAQFKHEIRKKQRETNKLMERLHQLLVDKNPDRKVGMDMVGFLPRGDNKRSTWKTSGNNKQEEMYQVIISNYEEKQQELRLENNELRDCLHHMQRELSSVLDRTESNRSTPQKVEDSSIYSSENDLSSIPNHLHNELSDGHFQMPYDLMRDNLQKSFQETCRRIKENMRKTSRQSGGKSCSNRSTPSKSPSSLGTDNKRADVSRKEELDKLEKQIEKYKDIVRQQEELIQQSLRNQSRSIESSFLHESQLLQEKEMLTEEKKMFQTEKAHFDEERKKYTESAIKLGKERKLLNEERVQVLTNQFLQLSPFENKPPTPPKRASKGDSSQTRLLPSTPVFSPAPSGKVKTPSTAELYRILGLTPKTLAKMSKSTPLEKESPRSASTESLLSENKSSPSDLTVSSAKRLSFEDLEDCPKRINTFQKRRSSTGSKNGLD